MKRKLTSRMIDRCHETVLEYVTTNAQYNQAHISQYASFHIFRQHVQQLAKRILFVKQRMRFIGAFTR